MKKNAFRNLTAICFVALIATFPANAIELRGIDHFAVNVADLQRSADWYRSILGFELIHRWKTTWMVGRDNVRVGLFLRPSAKPLPDIDTSLIIQHVAFLVDGDRFKNATDDLVKAGVKIEGPEDTGIAFSVFFKDPDGNLLEITTYHPEGEPKASDSGLKPFSLHGP